MADHHPPADPPPPRPDRGPATADGRGVLARMMLALAVAIGLSSGELLATAEALPFGPTRTVLVAAADTLDRGAGRLRLDQPRHLLDRALGRTTETVVVGGRSQEPPPDEQALAGPPAPVASGRSPPPEPAGPTIPEGPPEPGPAVTRGPSLAGDPAEPPRVVEEDRPLLIWAGGDSLGEYIGNRLLHPLADGDKTEVELDYHISTGLARPDYFDWPDRIGQLMARAHPPEVLVFMVGGNDNQPMATPNGVVATASADWYDEYDRRAASVMDLVTEAGGHLYWIGLPPMRDAERHEIAAETNRRLAAAAERRPGVTFVDVEELLAGPDGGFRSQVVGPDGQLRSARAADGVHITSEGSSWVADRVWAAIEGRWRLALDVNRSGR